MEPACGGRQNGSQQRDDRPRCGEVRADIVRSAVEQAVHEPLEADRHFMEPSSQLAGHAIDHAARHHRLADRG